MRRACKEQLKADRWCYEKGRWKRGSKREKRKEREREREQDIAQRRPPLRSLTSPLLAKKNRVRSSLFLSLSAFVVSRDRGTLCSSLSLVREHALCALLSRRRERGGTKEREKKEEKETGKLPPSSSIELSFPLVFLPRRLVPLRDDVSGRACRGRSTARRRWRGPVQALVGEK